MFNYEGILEIQRVIIPNDFCIYTLCTTQFEPPLMYALLHIYLVHVGCIYLNY